MMRTWKVIRTESPTIEELFRFTEPSKVRKVELQYGAGTESCRSISAQDDSNHFAMSMALNRVVGKHHIADVIYVTGGARVLVTLCA